MGFTQNPRVLRGKVVHNNTPIPFANIYFKNKNIGAMTDSVGNYIIKSL
jgi:hypothetical protein